MLLYTHTYIYIYTHTSWKIQLQVITVEPGCYFIDSVLDPAMESSKTSRFFNQKEIDRFRHFGGVRIESDVVLFLL